MGYEIVFSFHSKDDETGKYDTENVKSFTKNIGKKSEEVTLEKVAAEILGQLARRDIWVVNVEVFEFAKREITFKETKNGIVIKNRKFLYGQIQGDLVSEEVEEAPKSGAHKPVVKPATPVRYETFNPSRDDQRILSKQGLKFTVGKHYPILEEKIKGGPMEPLYYLTEDDGGNRIELSSLFFEPMRKGLVGMPEQQRNDSRLTYSNQMSMDMPVLRRGM